MPQPRTNSEVEAGQQSQSNDLSHAVLQKLQSVQGLLGSIVALCPNTKSYAEDSCWDVIRIDKLLKTRNYEDAVLARADAADAAIELALCEIETAKRQQLGSSEKETSRPS